MDHKEILVRAGKTFLQTFIATLLAGFTGVIDFKHLQTILGSAALAGLAAAVSYLQNTYGASKNDQAL